MRILTIANMYPSRKNPEFGTFIKVIEDGIKDKYPDIRADHAVIDTKPCSASGKLMNYIRFYYGILRRLLFVKYDLVYVHTITFPVPALRLARYFRKPDMVINVHGADVITATSISERLKRMSIPLLRECRLVIVPSEYFRGVMKENYPWLEDEKIIVSASGGVESYFFNDSAIGRHSQLQIGYVSRIVKGKGWDTFIKALARLKESGIDFHATIAGNGDMENDMRAMVSDYGLESLVSIPGGIGHRELPSLIKGFDVFVFPSENRSESLGLVGLEAMAGSVPVIGSDIGGIPTYLKDSFNGFLFEPGNDLQLYKRLVEIRNMPDSHYLAMRRNAYSTALRYETSAVVSALTDRLFE